MWKYLSSTEFRVNFDFHIYIEITYEKLSQNQKDIVNEEQDVAFHLNA